MIRAHWIEQGRARAAELGPDIDRLPDACVWLDLLRPDRAEEQAAERWLGVDLPTPEERQEIEASSRLYEQDGAVVMTATLVTSAESTHPQTSAVTFVLTAHCLVTIRYADSKAFDAFRQTVARQSNLLASRQLALASLLDALIERLADILELVQANLETTSREVFDERGGLRGRDFHGALTAIGRNGDRVSKVRESLVSFARLDGFARRLDAVRGDPHAATRLKTVSEDIQSLTDHATFLNSKVDFLLSATLGRINVEQNATIKIFSVVAVIFMPPTLIASIYGMNFEHMPELSWVYGYPAALIAMIVAAILPYVVFKLRGWL